MRVVSMQQVFAFDLESGGDGQDSRPRRRSDRNVTIHL
jgi:hypothetical protein